MVKGPTEAESTTVMFVDIVDYTKITSQLSREEFNYLHDVFDNISLPIFSKYSGRVVKKIGDAFMVTFKSPTNAVLCGIALQESFQEYNLNKKTALPLKIKVAIHTGEVIIRGNDVYGDAVNVTARIESIAKQGDVVFSEDIYKTMNKNEIDIVYLGQHKFKGLKQPLKIFRVKKVIDKLIQKKKEKKLKRKRIFKFIKKLILKIILLLFLSAFIYGTIYFYKNLF
ncbi:hypothetical protein COY27_06775 [Candidatus Woesearchaeota archaeon CG_4_10_14_0_2_um_filter_33_13]|nr:MAG: hypothetical protein COY27_06775 [Candidatus Woesearchaeota archaeon CG_4_10_14_0_2_um_filter_33_13]